MASYSSAFESHAIYNREDLVKKIAEIMYGDTSGGHSEADHDFQVLLNGILIYDSIEYGASHGYLDHFYAITPQSEQTEEEIEIAEKMASTIDADIQAVMVEANVLVKQSTEAATKQKELDEQKKQQKEKEDKDIKDRKKYEQLKAKYEV